MKITFSDPEDDLLPEYSFDYRKAKPNRFVMDKGKNLSYNTNQDERLKTINGYSIFKTSTGSYYVLLPNGQRSDSFSSWEEAVEFTEHQQDREIEIE